MSRNLFPVNIIEVVEESGFSGVVTDTLEAAHEHLHPGNGNLVQSATSPTLGLAQRGICRWVMALAALLLAVTGARSQAIFSTVQPVGSTATQTVTVQKASGAVGKVEVLTLGASGLDFADDPADSNCLSAAVADTSCSESVSFTPGAPGLRQGAVVLLDSGGNLLGTTLISGTGSGGLGVFIPGTMLTVAGDGQWTLVLDKNLATTADLDLPSSITLDGAGNMYIADSAHNRVRIVCASATSATINGVSCIGAGIMMTIAGNGGAAYTGDNGPASAATLNSPSGITIDGAGNLYIADTANNVIRKITAATGIITTFAGNGVNPGGYTGDGSPATSFELNQPWGVTLDPAGNLYIADTFNHRIRMVDTSGNISTVAGNGFTNPNGSGGYSGDGVPATQTELNYPYAVAFDSSGNMYIPDSGNHRIRMVAAPVATGNITTFAGDGTPGFFGDKGAAVDAELYSPSGVAFDPAGNLYIADTQNDRIRKVSSATGEITTIAGNGAGIYGGDNGSATSAGIYGPYGLYLDGNGNLFIADYFDHRIREIQSNQAILNFKNTPIRQGNISAPQIQTVENDGNGALDLTAFDLVANAALDATTTTCVTGIPYLAVDGDCAIGAEFAPATAGDPLLGNIDILSDTSAGVVAPNSPLDITLLGDALAVNSTTMVLTSSKNPSSHGDSVTFTATVTTGAGTGSLTGSVTFAVDGVNLSGAPVTVNASGAAAYVTSSLAVGSHTISASYNLDGSDQAHFSSTGTLTPNQVVNEATAISLISSGNPSALGANVTFTATVTTPSGGGVTPDGSVIFTDTTKGTILDSVPLSTVNGVTSASFSTSTLTQGLHTITATYGGDAVNYILGCGPASVSQDVQAPSNVVVTSNPNPSNYGSPVTFTVTVANSGSAAPTGTVDILDGGAQIGTTTLVGSTGIGTFTTSSLSIGPHTITAAYQGDANYSPSTSGPITQQVNQALTSTAVTAFPSPGIAGAAVALTATVKVVAGAGTPTGSVTFTDTTNGATVTLGSASLTGSTAAINPILAPGSHSIVATYNGDTDDGGSASAALPLTVVLATTSTVVTSAPNPALILATITFTAKVTGNGGIPTGSVNFLSNGASMGSANLDATGTATLTYSGLSAASYQITAVYAGDADDSPSTSAAITQVVGVIPTVTDLGSATTTGANPQVILVATVIGSTGPTPTGTVTFKEGSNTVGVATLDSSGVATLTPNLSAGQHSVVAVYSGDALHGPSTSQAVTITVPAADFDLTVTPASVSMTSGQNATLTVTLTSNGGFTDTIGLGCGSLPAAVNCHFSRISATLTANGISTAQLTIDTNNPLSGGTTAKNAHPGNRGVFLAGLLAPFSVLFGFFIWRFRKRHAFALIAVLLLSGAALLATGCSGFTQKSAAPGTYVIQVNGVGADSNVSRYQNVTLTIGN